MILGAIKVIQGEGMPQYKRPFDKGNLNIKFNVIFPPPHWIEEAKIKALEDLLPARPALDSVADNVIVDEVMLQDLDPRSGRTGHRGSGSSGAGRGHAHDSDDDDEGGGGPQVQCAQQ